MKKLNPFILNILIVWLITGCTSPPTARVSNPTLPAKAEVIVVSSPSPSATIKPASTPTPRPTSTAMPTELPEVYTQLAWFYKPPSDGDLYLVADHFDFFILTYGDESEWEIVRDSHLKGPILQYLRFEAIQDPGSCTRQPWRNQVAYLPGDFCTISAEHPEWFMLDQNGERIIDYYDGEKFVMMDPGNQDWQKFWLERAIQVQEQPGWDGVFLDNVEITMAFRENENGIPAAYQDETSYQAAVQSFLKFIAEDYFKPRKKLLYANLVARKDDATWNTYLGYLDGAMYEGWAIDKEDGYRSPDTWERHLQVAEATQSQGKSILLISQGHRDEGDLQQFAYASYLLVNEGRAAFRYAHSSRYREAWLYPNYALDLGQPLGARYQVGDVWRRDFDNGQVEVNPIQHTAHIIVSNASDATAVPGGFR